MDNYPATFDVLGHLGVALGVGLTIGLERGWKERDAPEGSRIAGWRTFGLIGLAGGLWSILAGANPVVLAVALLAILIALSAAHWQEAAAGGERSITTLIAAAVAFALGALAGAGRTVEAAAVAVVVTLLLSAKSVLHAWLRRLTEREFRALLRFLLISVVILPLLPDRAMGPYGALNPHNLWTIVVLVAGLSFIGYAAMRIWGEHAGAMLTAILGGIVSSTAVAHGFARRSTRTALSPQLLAAGIMAATAVSFARTFVLVGIFQFGLLSLVAPPLAALIAVSTGAAWLLWRRSSAPATIEQEPVSNPLELRSAIQLAVVLAVMLVGVEALRSRLGAAGLEAVTALAGTVDIDAATISVCKLIDTGLDHSAGATMLLFGLAGNGLLKVALAMIFGRRALWGAVLVGYGVTAMVGAAVAVMAL